MLFLELKNLNLVSFLFSTVLLFSCNYKSNEPFVNEKRPLKPVIIKASGTDGSKVYFQVMDNGSYYLKISKDNYVVQYQGVVCDQSASGEYSLNPTKEWSVSLCKSHHWGRPILEICDFSRNYADEQLTATVRLGDFDTVLIVNRHSKDLDFSDKADDEVEVELTWNSGFSPVKMHFDYNRTGIGYQTMLKSDDSRLFIIRIKGKKLAIKEFERTLPLVYQEESVTYFDMNSIEKQ